MKNLKKNQARMANLMSLARFLLISYNGLKNPGLEQFQDKNSHLMQCKTRHLNFTNFQLNSLTNPITLGSAAMHG